MKKIKSKFNVSNFKKVFQKLFSFLFSLFTGFRASREDGFGLLEAMVSMFIMITVITGAMYLVSGGILNIGVAEDRLVAINLAQEGLEVVHNVRDTNWLADPSRPWNDWNTDGTADNCSGGCNGYVLWNSTKLEAGASVNLRWNGANHYDNSAGAGDVFTQIITITGSDVDNNAKIQATVGWGGAGSCTEGSIDSGRKYCVTLEERLYNWLQ